MRKSIPAILVFVSFAFWAGSQALAQTPSPRQPSPRAWPVTFVPSASLCAEGSVCAPEGRLFPLRMQTICRAKGGGNWCAGTRWNRALYRETLEECVPRHGLELCSDLRCGEAPESLCSADLGPFPQPMIDRCLAAEGGEEVCKKGAWNAAFYESVLDACVLKAGAEACLGEASLRFGQSELPIIARWPTEWNGVIDAALEDPRNAKLLLEDFLPREDMAGPAGAQMCPGYFGATRAQKKAFLTAFVAAIARWESNFDPGAFNGADPGGGSWGLMQLSYPDGNRADYQPCRINRSESNITDPSVNLACGVSILRRQVELRGRLLHSRSDRFYWRVLEVYGENAIAPYVPRTVARLRAQMPFCNL